jgi:hypothetical protein
MHLLPLLNRELCVAARKPLTRWLKVGVGGGAMGAAVWAILVWGSSSRFSGFTLFYVIAAAGYVGAVLTGLLRGVDAISLERRDDTLPLLFLTDLSVWDVLLGKLAGIVSVPLLTLCSIFPALVICELVGGGITSAELWRTMIGIVLTLLYSASATLFISTLARERRTVVLGSVLLLLATFGAFISAPHGRMMIWVGLIGSSALTLVFLLVSAVLLERNWRSDARAPAEKAVSAQRAATSKVSMEASPIAWLMLRRWPARGFIHWVATLSLVVAGVLAAYEVAAGGYLVALIVLVLVHFAILFAMLAHTAYAFFNEKHEGSFEALISTPLVNEDLFSGFARFLRLRYLRLLAAVTVYDAVLSLTLARGASRQLAPFPAAMALIVWISFFGIRWLGVYRSLMMKFPLLAVTATFVRLSLGPLIFSVLFLFAPRTDFFKVCVFWVGATGFLAVFFGSEARRILLERGRELLLRPASDKAPHIESQWSFINWDGVQYVSPDAVLTAAE